MSETKPELPRCAHTTTSGKPCGFPVTKFDPTRKRCGIHYHADLRAEKRRRGR